MTGDLPTIDALEEMEPGDTLVLNRDGNTAESAVERVQFPKPWWREVVLEDLRAHVVRGSMVDFTDHDRESIMDPLAADALATGGLNGVGGIDVWVERDDE
jgi:hypothetical protein